MPSRTCQQNTAKALTSAKHFGTMSAMVKSSISKMAHSVSTIEAKLKLARKRAKAMVEGTFGMPRKARAKKMEALLQETALALRAVPTKVVDKSYVASERKLKHLRAETRKAAKDARAKKLALAASVMADIYRKNGKKYAANVNSSANKAIQSQP